MRHPASAAAVRILLGRLFTRFARWLTGLERPFNAPVVTHDATLQPCAKRLGSEFRRSVYGRSGAVPAPNPVGKEVVAVIFEVVMFILSAFGLVAAGKEFLQRGHNLGLWGA